MTGYLRTDQYTHLDRSCPMRTDLHPADDRVEIVIGERRFGEDTLRLVVDDPDTLARLRQALDEAGTKLTEHLYAKAHSDPAMSQLDMTLRAPVVR